MPSTRVLAPAAARRGVDGERRRASLWMAASLATVGLPLHAQEARVWRVGVIKIVAHAALDAAEKGFEAGLSSAGFRDGHGVVYLRHDAQGDPVRARAAAAALVAERVDLIHAIATPSSQAVMQTGSRIPLVFSAVTDPVRAGLVPAGSAPGQRTGTHVTGVSDLWPVQLQMETYARAHPQARAWGTIYNPQEANSLTHVQAMREAFQRLGLTLVEARVGHRSEVPAAARDLAGRVQALAITSDNTTVSALEALVAVCVERKLPLFAGDIDSVARGAVMAYGLDYFLVGYAAGRKASLVLKGIRPGDVPWGPVEKFSLVINRRAAREQGIELPAELLARADRIIDR